MDTQKKWVVPLMIWVVFETVAVTLWLTKDNLFYLFNFSYIGSAIAIGFLLLQFRSYTAPYVMFYLFPYSYPSRTYNFPLPITAKPTLH